MNKPQFLKPRRVEHQLRFLHPQPNQPALPFPEESPHNYRDYDLSPKTVGSSHRFLRSQSSFPGSTATKNTSTATLIDQFPTSLADSLVPLRPLGHGASGSVYAVHFRHAPSQMLALKVIPKKAMKPAVLQAVLNEQAALKRLVGVPGFLQLEASFHDRKNFYLATSLYLNGDLEAMLDRCGRVPLALARFWAADLVLGLEALHREGIIHRDLKPANILIDDTRHLILGDFGLAKVFSSEPRTPSDVRPYWLLSEELREPGPYITRTSCGSPAYAAPERVCGFKYGFEVDYWSMGVTLFEIITGRLPWYTKDLHKLAVQIVHDPFVFREGECMDQLARDFIYLVLAKVPCERLDVLGMKSHPYFRHFDWHKMSIGSLPVPCLPLSPHQRPRKPAESTPTIKTGLAYSRHPLGDPHPEFNFHSKYIQLTLEGTTHRPLPDGAHPQGYHGMWFAGQQTTFLPIATIRRRIIRYIRRRPRLKRLGEPECSEMMSSSLGSDCSPAISHAHADCGGIMAPSSSISLLRR